MSAAEIDAVLLRALCVDHGHARQAGGMSCRTCKRRVGAIWVALLTAGYTITLIDQLNWQDEGTL